MRQVIDASVVLAYLLGETGGDALDSDDGPFCLSSVSLAEILTKGIDRDLAPGEIMRVLKRFPIEHFDYGRDDAAATAALRKATRRHGLSLGDRACLALAERLGLSASTADRAWAKLELAIDIRLIR